MRGDGQKPHSEGPACGASWHRMTKPSGSGGRVNAALVHGKFTFLLGEICAPCGVVLMVKRPWWCRTRNHLARDCAARSQGERTGSNPSGHVARPAVMHRVSAQKSAAAIRGGTGGPGHRRAKHRTTRRSRAILACSSEPRPGESRAALAHAAGLVRILNEARADAYQTLHEPPGADPHAGWCGGRGLKTSGYPIRPHAHSLRQMLRQPVVDIAKYARAPHP